MYVTFLYLLIKFQFSPCNSDIRVSKITFKACNYDILKNPKFAVADMGSCPTRDKLSSTCWWCYVVSPGAPPCFPDLLIGLSRYGVKKILEKDCKIVFKISISYNKRRGYNGYTLFTLIWILNPKFIFEANIALEASVAERLSYPLCKPGVVSSIPGFSSLLDGDFKPRSRLRLTLAVGGT